MCGITRFSRSRHSYDYFCRGLRQRCIVRKSCATPSKAANFPRVFAFLLAESVVLGATSTRLTSRWTRKHAREYIGFASSRCDLRSIDMEHETAFLSLSFPLPLSLSIQTMRVAESHVNRFAATEFRASQLSRRHEVRSLNPRASTCRSRYPGSGVFWLRYNVTPKCGRRKRVNKGTARSSIGRHTRLILRLDPTRRGGA